MRKRKTTMKMMIAPSKSITVEKEIHYQSLLRPEDKKDGGRIVGGWRRQTTLLTVAWDLDFDLCDVSVLKG
ncbi:hypothetical protein D5086_018981 [Populus alba]|uniref:Uncharacterized protein n=1 Tax=Populus alba TaxID=43335 RepID=A0ACC4BHC7_POPAL